MTVMFSQMGRNLLTIILTTFVPTVNTELLPFQLTQASQGSPKHDQLLHQLLQSFLLRGHRDCQPDSNACADHSVHQRLQQSAANLLSQDDRRLPDILPPNTLR